MVEEVTADQRLFKQMIEIVEGGEPLKVAAYTVDGGRRFALAKKIYRLYLPLYGVACALEWPPLKLFDDLHAMTARL